MADNYQFVQLQTLTLKGSGAGSTDTSIELSSMTFPVSGDTVVMADFGAMGYATLEPGTAREENISFTGITQNADGSATLTGVTRGLDFAAPYTNIAALQQTHAGGTACVVSNSAAFYNELAAKDNDETITGTWTFPNGTPPRVDSYSAPVDDEELAAKKYVDDIAAGGTASINRTVVSGTAGETVAAGNAVYFDETDNEWKLANAGAAATSEGVQLGVAQGAGTDGNAISGGVLLFGREENQSGLTAGDRLYLTDVNGVIGAAAGTKEVEIGHAISTTTIDFTPRYDKSLSEDEQDALAGTSGTPSASNLFVTNDDTTGTGDVVRTSVTDANRKFGGDGSDGALTLTSGTTTIDLSNAKVVVKNYTAISITGTGDLAFTNPHASGTLIILKSQGDVTLTSSTAPMIDASALGATGGADPGLGNPGIGGSNGAGFIFSTLGGTAGSGATGGVATTAVEYVSSIQGKVYMVAPGAGGASGTSNTTSGGSGVGGRGGGGLVVECGGAWNFTTASGISVAGANGSNGATASGGGGGGAGGIFLAMYETLTTNTGTVTIAGGNGRTGGIGINDNAGKGGGGGASGAFDGAAAGDGNTGAGTGAGGAGGAGGASGAGSAGSNGTSGGGGGGGGGGAGESNILSNTAFA